MKARPVSIAIAFDGAPRVISSGSSPKRRGPLIRRPVMHVLIVDADGNVHERADDMPAGVWSTWDRDWLPARRVSTAKVNRKARRISEK